MTLCGHSSNWVLGDYFKGKGEEGREGKGKKEGRQRGLSPGYPGGYESLPVCCGYDLWQLVNTHTHTHTDSF